MPPIDPYQLLSALSPLLGPGGGMKSAEEVVKLASLMKKFSKKLVSRCVYIQILKATDLDILQKFLDEGGWEIVNTWLKEGKEKEDYGFLVELLELYKKLPMTVEKLKENNSARIIKALCKVDDESMKQVAQEIVGAWMKLVKGEKNDAPPPEKTKKKKKHHHDKSEQKDKLNSSANDSQQEGALKAPSNQVVPSKKGTLRSKRTVAEKKPDKLTKSLKRTNADDLEDAKPMVIAIEKPAKKVKKDKRPSTVKTYRASFRATGLEDAPSTDKPVSKKGKGGDKVVPVLTIKRPANSIVDLNSPPPDKKVKPASLIMPVDGTKESSSILSTKVPAVSKPKPVHHVLQDSAGFMDALVAAPPQPVRKKKKATPKSNSTDAASPTTPVLSSPSTAESKPQFQFYKDTLESPKEKTMPEVKLTSDGERTPSPPPEEKEEHDKENKIQEVAKEPSPTKEEAQKSPTTEDENSGSKLKQGETKKKKTVTWAEDSVLKEVFYFALDENERVNVNNVKNFGDMKFKELQMEKQAMMNARRLKGDNMEEQIAWVMPKPFSNVSTFERGMNSTEKETQKVRQEGVLQFLFFSKDSRNESPQEPDPETNVVNTNTKIIPLEDETNQDAVIDYSNFNLLPKNNFMGQDLPAPLTNLVMSMNQNHQLKQMLPPTNMMHPPENDMPGMAPQHFDQFYNDSPQGGPPRPLMMRVRGGPMRSPMMNQPPPNMGMMRPPRDFQPRVSNMRPQWRAPGPRGGLRGGPRRVGSRYPYIPCKHFMEGSCPYGESCRFLHPGINGPPL